MLLQSENQWYLVIAYNRIPSICQLFVTIYWTKHWRYWKRLTFLYGVDEQSIQDKLDHESNQALKQLIVLNFFVSNKIFYYANFARFLCTLEQYVECVLNIRIKSIKCCISLSNVKQECTISMRKFETHL